MQFSLWRGFLFDLEKFMNIFVKRLVDLRKNNNYKQTNVPEASKVHAINIKVMKREK